MSNSTLPAQVDKFCFLTRLESFNMIQRIKNAEAERKSIFIAAMLSWTFVAPANWIVIILCEA
jgi:hypothetical protein